MAKGQPCAFHAHQHNQLLLPMATVRGGGGGGGGCHAVRIELWDQASGFSVTDEMIGSVQLDLPLHSQFTVVPSTHRLSPRGTIRIRMFLVPNKAYLSSSPMRRISQMPAGSVQRVQQIQNGAGGNMLVAIPEKEEVSDTNTNTTAGSGGETPEWETRRISTMPAHRPQLVRFEGAVKDSNGTSLSTSNSNGKRGNKNNGSKQNVSNKSDAYASSSSSSSSSSSNDNIGATGQGVSLLLFKIHAGRGLQDSSSFFTGSDR